MIQLRAQAANQALIPIEPKVLETSKMMGQMVTRGAGGQLAWPSLLRKLDRVDGSFRS